MISWFDSNADSKSMNHPVCVGKVNKEDCSQRIFVAINVLYKGNGILNFKCDSGNVNSFIVVASLSVFSFYL